MSDTMQTMTVGVEAIIKGSPRLLTVTITGGDLTPDEIPAAMYVIGEAFKQGAIEAANELGGVEKAVKLAE